MKDTATINISEYNELRDIRENVLKGKKVCVTTLSDYASIGVHTNYYTDDEIVAELSKRIDSLKEIVREKEECIHSLESTTEKMSDLIDSLRDQLQADKLKSKKWWKIW